MFYDSDIDTFFKDFSQTVVYTPSGGSQSSIDAIYDAPGNVITLPAGASIQVVDKQVIVKTSDVPNISTKDTITIGSTTYYTRGYTPDGMGLTTITLSEE